MRLNARLFYIAFMLTGIFGCLTFVFVSIARGEEVHMDMERIKRIESDGDPRAFNKQDGGRGLYQITPIVLEEWNNFHPTDRLAPTDLWDPAVNFKVANWYMNKRIPQMLRYFKLCDTPKNRIICYNAGIKKLVKNLPIPQTTIKYLKKYGI